MKTIVHGNALGKTKATMSEAALARLERRCSGHCCRTFVLHFDRHEAVTAREERIAQGELVVDLDEAGNCTVYDQRPSMCRRYPYDESPCAFRGCTLDDRPNIAAEWGEIANGPLA